MNEREETIWWIIFIITFIIIWYVAYNISHYSLWGLLFIIACYIAFQYWLNKWTIQSPIVNTKEEVKREEVKSKIVKKIKKVFKDNASELNSSMKMQTFTVEWLWLREKDVLYKPLIIKIWPKSIWYHRWNYSHWYEYNCKKSIEDFIDEYIEIDFSKTDNI
jgi:hypothetical protein